MHSINETMRYKKVPEHLQRRVHRFYEFMHGSCTAHTRLSPCTLATHPRRARANPLPAAAMSPSAR